MTAWRGYERGKRGRGTGRTDVTIREFGRLLVNLILLLESMVGCEGGIGGEDGVVEDEEMVVQGLEHGLRAKVRRDGGPGRGVRAWRTGTGTCD